MYEYGDKGPFGSSPARLPKANDPVAMLKLNDDKLGTSFVGWRLQRMSVVEGGRGVKGVRNRFAALLGMTDGSLCAASDEIVTYPLGLWHHSTAQR
jgi:hypothetical protein